MSRIESTARNLFEIDTEITRDREQYKTFDAMPPALQNWWRDRAERKVDELRLLANTGYDPHRDM